MAVVEILVAVLSITFVVSSTFAVPLADDDDTFNPDNIIEIDPFSEVDNSSNPLARVIGGRNANPHIAPWIVSLQIMSERYGSYHFCGGSIIKPDWVITAGHCFKGQKGLQNVVVSAGRHNLAASEPTEQLRWLKVVYIHPRYTGGVGPNDLALVQVKQAFTYDSTVQEIALPVAGSQPVGSATLYGWGSTTNLQRSPLPTILQTMTVSLISVDQCKSAMASFANYIQNTNICTVGGYNGRPAACSGDSGSGLSQNGVIIGTVSWGLTPCASTQSASVYVRVSAFTRWISNVINRHV